LWIVTVELAGSIVGTEIEGLWSIILSLHLIVLIVLVETGVVVVVFI
jgi:hypothetical protein